MNGYGYLIVGIVVVAIIALLATNKKFVETLKNIYKIEELRKRILYTLGLLLVYRLGWLFRALTPTPWARGRRLPVSWRATVFWAC